MPNDLSQQYRFVADATPFGLIEYDTSATITFANDRFRKLLGLQQSPVGSKIWDLLWPAEQRQQAILDFVNLQQQQPEPEPQRLQITASDSGNMVLQLRWDYLRQQDKVVGFIALVQPWTGLSSDDEATLLSRVLELSHHSALGRIASAVAHDLNNLLTGVLGNAELALMELEDGGDRGAEAVEQVMVAARRAADVARQLLTYTGRREASVGPVNLSLLVEQMTKLLSLSVPKSATVKTQLEKKLPAVVCPAVALRRIVLNLVSNAGEAYGEEGGAVELSTGSIDSDDKQPPSWLPSDLPSGRYVYLRVTDRGCGMDRAAIEKMCDPFYSRHGGSRGLGLTVVERLLVDLGGGLGVYSEPGRGTTVAALFPVQAAEAVQKKQVTTILVVDDERAVRLLATRSLEREGYQVINASDGEEALDLLRSNAGKISMVVLDMALPKLSGDDVYRALRQEESNLPVLLTSGFGEPEILEKCSGSTGFMRKPFGPSDLVARVKKALESL